MTTTDDELEVEVSVHEAITRVIGAMPGIGKDSEIKEGAQRYRYRGIEAIKAELKPLLAEHLVHYVGEIVVDSVEFDTVPVGDRGKTWQRTRFLVCWTIYGPNGDAVTAVTLGEGVDSSDKSANKAMTTAEKQMLLTTFCVADGDDPDHARPEITEPDPGPVAWPAGNVKQGMVIEIARQVTAGDMDRATELAALAWDTFGLGKVAELPADEAQEKIDAAVDLARQETSTDDVDGGGDE